jgi:hypothetical protein
MLVFSPPQNPFDSVSAEELEEYKRIINKREKGGGDESPVSPRDETIADTMGDTTDPGSNPLTPFLCNVNLQSL